MARLPLHIMSLHETNRVDLSPFTHTPSNWQRFVQALARIRSGTGTIIARSGALALRLGKVGTAAPTFGSPRLGIRPLWRNLGSTARGQRSRYKSDPFDGG